MGCGAAAVYWAADNGVVRGMMSFGCMNKGMCLQGTASLSATRH